MGLENGNIDQIINDSLIYLKIFLEYYVSGPMDRVKTEKNPYIHGAHILAV